ncbi:MAG: acyl-CoA dehydrogenase [Paraglaciecola sp.]|jgi:acyl-CoA dehydrogenase
MNFAFTEKSLDLQSRLKAFMDKHIYPLEKAEREWNHANPWKLFPEMERLKALAKAEGLWNLFLPEDYGDWSPGLTNLEYAPLAQEMGKVEWASEIFNCNAPDTGNMEVFAKFGSDAHKEKWLKPLLAGKIRSAFLMTEPAVASSDARNISTSIVRDGDEYVINGRKWWSSNMMHPNCKVTIVMGKTDPEASSHSQQSMIIVPVDTPGFKIIRPLPVFGYYDSPVGHCEVELKDVRVPVENLIMGEGKGFAIAQGRLGPGRIHHCMRLVGKATRALEYMCKRVSERETFGKSVGSYSSIRQDVARSACQIEQARLLTLSAADSIDRKGIKGSKDLIAMIKIVAPSMVCDVTDRAMQAFGGKGFTEDTPLAAYWMSGRVLRMADGPDEVHMYQLGRNIIGRYAGDESLHTPYFDEE